MHYLIYNQYFKAHINERSFAFLSYFIFIISLELNESTFFLISPLFLNILLI